MAAAMQSMLVQGMLVHLLWLSTADGGALTLKYAFSVPYAKSLDMYVSAAEVTLISIDGLGHVVQTVQPGSTHVPLQGYINSYPTLNGIDNSTIIVSADKEVSIHVTVVMRSLSWQSKGFLVLPATDGSTEYLVTSYNSTEYLAVSSHLNVTNVKVELHTPSQTVNFTGRQYSNGVIDTTLNEYNTALVQYSNPTVAARIVSNKPVSVGIYDLCARVNGYACGLITEQFLPIAYWKRTLLIGMLNTRTQYTIRIISSKNNNRIKVGNDTVLLNDGEIHEEHVYRDIAIAIEADQPVLVLQYSEGYDYPTGGTAMFTIPAVGHFLPVYTFTVPTGHVSNHVTISIESRFVSGLRHNGNPLSGAIERQATTSGDTNKVYSVVRFVVNAGVHRLAHEQHGVKFGAILYGFGYSSAYGFPLGLALRPGCSPLCQNGGLCVSVNVCRCMAGFFGSYCQQGSAIDEHLKPELHTTIPGYSLADPLAWYEQPSFTDNNKVCYVKVNVQNGHGDLVVSATSSTGGGLVYGNFTMAPIDSSSSFQGPSRIACLEVRCPFATINGTIRSTVVHIAVHNSNQSCSVSHHTHSIPNITVTSGQTNSDEIEFTLEAGKNYGPYYGVYYSMGTLGKAKYLAEHKCNSGHEYDFDSFNTDVGVLASYTC